jgi:hypothetical protein
MGARNRAQNRDQDHQDGAGRNRVPEQRHRLVSTCEPFRHDAGADHGRDQHPGAESLRKNTPV